MPYGVSKSLGGDSPQNDAHMERMVTALQRQGHDKVSAIKIAKASMHKKPKTDPRMDALSDLHQMLSHAIGSKLKAKHRDPQTEPADGDSRAEEADEPDEQLNAQQSDAEEADEKKLAHKKQKHFGPGLKK